MELEPPPDEASSPPLEIPETAGVGRAIWLSVIAAPVAALNDDVVDDDGVLDACDAEKEWGDVDGPSDAPVGIPLPAIVAAKLMGRSWSWGAVDDV